MKHKHSNRKNKYKHWQRRTKPGASPGSVVVDPAAKKSQLHVLAYNLTQVQEVNEATLEDVTSLMAQFPIVWLNVEGLGDAQLIEKIGVLFGLHRLALEDVVNVHQRAKMEHYGQDLFFVSRMAFSDEHFHSEQVSLFLKPNLLITFQEGSPGDTFEAVRQRIRTATGKIRSLGTDYLTYALIDALIDSYFPVLETVGEKLDHLEENMFSNSPNHDLIDELHSTRSSLRHMRRAVWPLRETLGEMLRESTTQFHDGTKIYLRDCYDHVIQLLDILETYRELGADLRDLYMSSVSNRINETMRVLTIISTIFIPLTFIAGIYGMNFDTSASPWNMPELNWKYGYALCLLLMAITTVCLLIFFYRMRWILLGRRE
jgi:magnesium transporter